MPKKIYDGDFEWDGWGGPLKLVSGRCRLRIYDLHQISPDGPTPIRSVLIVVSDYPEAYGAPGTMSVRSCAAQIASGAVARFQLDPLRMIYVEHYPQRSYGTQNEKIIPQRNEAVEFQWRQNKAFGPKWRPLDPTETELVSRCIAG